VERERERELGGGDKERRGTSASTSKRAKPVGGVCHQLKR